MPASKKSTTVASRILVALFGLPFAAFGLGFFFWNVLPGIIDSISVQDWHPATANLLQVELVTSVSDGSSSYRATARYQYYYAGQTYTGDRVAVHNGGDNIGNFQQALDQRLEQAYQEKQPITVWVNPDEPSKSIADRDPRWSLTLFKLLFCVVFTAIGLGLIIYLITTRAKPAPVYGLDDSQADAPWLEVLNTNKDWPSNRIRSNAKRGMWFFWLFALVWNLISMPLMFALPGEVSTGNQLALIGLVFPVIGFGLVLAAIRKTREWQYFGPTLLTLDPFPGSIGGHVGGTVRLNVPFNPAVNYRVTLNNSYSHVSGSGKNRSRSESVQWQNSQIARSVKEQGGTLLTFRFDVPEGLNESQEATGNYYKWTIVLEAALEPVELARSFDIPVFATSKKSAAIENTGTAVMEGIRSQAIEQIMNVKQIPGGAELYFPAGRNAGMALAVFVTGLIFGGAGVWLWSETVFMSIMFLLFSIPCTLGGIYTGINSLRVRIDLNGVQTTRNLLGYKVIGRYLDRHQIKGIIYRKGSQQNMGSKVTVFYNLFIVAKNDSEIRIGESFTGAGQAGYAAESISLLTGIPCIKNHMQPTNRLQKYFSG